MRGILKIKVIGQHICQPADFAPAESQPAPPAAPAPPVEATPAASAAEAAGGAQDAQAAKAAVDQSLKDFLGADRRADFLTKKVNK